MLPRFMEGGEEADRVMPPCAGEAQEQGDVCLQFVAVAGESEKGIAEAVFVRGAVPAPRGVGEVPHVFRCVIPVMPARAGMGMDGGAVVGDGKAFPWHDAACHGRQDGRMVEELLQAIFEVERDVFPGHNAFFDHFDDFRLCLPGFLLLHLGLVWSPAVPGSGEQLVPRV